MQDTERSWSGIVCSEACDVSRLCLALEIRFGLIDIPSLKGVDFETCTFRITFVIC
jgi:hypothetical protein